MMKTYMLLNIRVIDGDAQITRVYNIKHLNAPASNSTHY